VITDSIFVIATPVNDLPTRFDLFSPSNNDSTALYPEIEFNWERSVDVVEDSTVTYTLILRYNNQDHRYGGLDDTTYSIDRADISIDPNLPTDIRWWVFASDGTDSLRSTHIYRLWVAPLGVREWDPRLIPDALTLGPVYPNPFNDVVTIQFGLPAPTDVILTIHDPMGRAIRRLESGMMSAGNYRIFWDGMDDVGNRAPSGLYFCRLLTPQGLLMERVILLR